MAPWYTYIIVAFFCSLFFTVSFFILLLSNVLYSYIFVLSLEVAYGWVLYSKYSDSILKIWIFSTFRFNVIITVHGFKSIFFHFFVFDDVHFFLFSSYWFFKNYTLLSSINLSTDCGFIFLLIVILVITICVFDFTFFIKLFIIKLYFYLFSENVSILKFFFKCLYPLLGLHYCFGVYIN